MFCHLLRLTPRDVETLDDKRRRSVFEVPYLLDWGGINVDVETHSRA